MAANLPANVLAWPTLWREQLDESAALLTRVMEQEGWTARELLLIAEAATRRKYRLEKFAESVVADGRRIADAQAAAAAHAAFDVIH